MTRRSAAAWLSPWLVLLCFTASAQSSPPIGIVDSPCPPSQPVSPEWQALLEKFLMPGGITKEFLKSLIEAPNAEARAQAQREQRERDWADLCKYKADNAALAAGRGKAQTVFMGDSITENWALADPGYFVDGRIGRGISGQTSPQMLVRFYADVIALHPQVVHIMAGTNDIAGNTGPTTLKDYQNNVLAMLDLAKVNHIKVVLAGVPPSENLFWRGIDPRSRIREINAWLQQVAKQRGIVFVDYAAVLADEQGGIKGALSNDGVHPNRDGYALMKPLAQQAILQALRR